MRFHARRPNALLIAGLLALGSAFVAGDASAKPATSRVRIEKAFGACIAVPISMFPRAGKTEVSERFVDDGTGGGTSVSEAIYRVAGRNDRDVNIRVAPSFVAPKIGWQVPVETQFITPTSDGYRAKGVWDAETEPPVGGPWFARTYRLAGGSALVVEIYLASGDDKKSAKDVSAMVASVHRC